MGSGFQLVVVWRMVDLCWFLTCLWCSFGVDKVAQWRCYECDVQSVEDIGCVGTPNLD